MLKELLTAKALVSPRHYDTWCRQGLGSIDDDTFCVLKETELLGKGTSYTRSEHSSCAPFRTVASLLGMLAWF